MDVMCSGTIAYSMFPPRHINNCRPTILLLFSTSITTKQAADSGNQLQRNPLCFCCFRRCLSAVGQTMNDKTVCPTKYMSLFWFCPNHFLLLWTRHSPDDFTQSHIRQTRTLRCNWKASSFCGEGTKDSQGTTWGCTAWLHKCPSCTTASTACTYKSIFVQKKLATGFGQIFALLLSSCQEMGKLRVKETRFLLSR